ncbi:MAG TPA: cupredoxin domain-containing protein [Actinomycetota bacterium]|nr:cupredoxin domain-containing protein [Actinomycetota bacterium]
MSEGVARAGRRRVPLALLIPVGGFLAIGLAAVGFARVLLSLAPHAATGTALAVAFGIMTIAALVARRERMRAGTLLAYVGAVAGVAMVAGGVALATIGRGAPHGPEAGVGEGAAPGPGTTVELVAPPGADAEGFAQTELAAPAGEPFTIRFDNREAGVPHNVAVYEQEDFSGQALAATTPEVGPATQSLDVPALDPGTYYFRCDVHPATMTGTLEVRPAEGGGAGGGGGGSAGGGAATAQVSAEGLAFSTATIELAAGRPSTIVFENREPVPHNLSIYRDQGFTDPVFQDPPFPGPATKEYEIPPLDPGTYYFRCDVHPTMTGTVEVS